MLGEFQEQQQVVQQLPSTLMVQQLDVDITGVKEDLARPPLFCLTEARDILPAMITEQGDKLTIWMNKRKEEFNIAPQSLSEFIQQARDLEQINLGTCERLMQLEYVSELVGLLERSQVDTKAVSACTKQAAAGANSAQTQAADLLKEFGDFRAWIGSRESEASDQRDYYAEELCCEQKKTIEAVTDIKDRLLTRSFLIIGTVPAVTKRASQVLVLPEPMEEDKPQVLKSSCLAKTAGLEDTGPRNRPLGIFVDDGDEAETSADDVERETRVLQDERQEVYKLQEVWRIYNGYAAFFGQEQQMLPELDRAAAEIDRLLQQYEAQLEDWECAQEAKAVVDAMPQPRGTLEVPNFDSPKGGALLLPPASPGGSRRPSKDPSKAANGRGFARSSSARWSAVSDATDMASVTRKWSKVGMENEVEAAVAAFSRQNSLSPSSRQNSLSPSSAVGPQLSVSRQPSKRRSADSFSHSPRGSHRSLRHAKTADIGNSQSNFGSDDEGQEEDQQQPFAQGDVAVSTCPSMQLQGPPEQPTPLPPGWRGGERPQLLPMGSCLSSRQASKSSLGSEDSEMPPEADEFKPEVGMKVCVRQYFKPRGKEGVLLKTGQRGIVQDLRDDGATALIEFPKPVGPLLVQSTDFDKLENVEAPPPKHRTVRRTKSDRPCAESSERYSQARVLFSSEETRLIDVRPPGTPSKEPPRSPAAVASDSSGSGATVAASLAVVRQSSSAQQI